MLTLLRDLVAHKGHANAAVLAAVGGSEVASADSELVDLLHHVLIANRFWICAVRRVPFSAAHEASELFKDLSVHAWFFMNEGEFSGAGAIHALRV